MKFKFTANCIFEAKDIDDAFLTVAKHFQSLAGDGDYDMIESGFVEIKPVDEDTPPALDISLTE